MAEHRRSESFGCREVGTWAGKEAEILNSLHVSLEVRMEDRGADEGGRGSQVVQAGRSWHGNQRGLNWILAGN